MGIKEFFEKLEKITISSEAVNKVNEVYSCHLPEQIKKIVSLASDGIFFDTGSFCRLLSFGEIINANDELHVDFKDKCILPLFDRGENNFIVYKLNDKIFAKFNIVDEVMYGGKNTLDDILK